VNVACCTASGDVERILGGRVSNSLQNSAYHGTDWLFDCSVESTRILDRADYHEILDRERP